MGNANSSYLEILISGCHGSGKTTLMEQLLELDETRLITLGSLKDPLSIQQKTKRFIQRELHDLVLQVEPLQLQVAPIKQILRNPNISMIELKKYSRMLFEFPETHELALMAHGSLLDLLNVLWNDPEQLGNCFMHKLLLQNPNPKNRTVHYTDRKVKRDPIKLSFTELADSWTFQATGLSFDLLFFMISLADFDSEGYEEALLRNINRDLRSLKSASKKRVVLIFTKADLLEKRLKFKGKCSLDELEEKVEMCVERTLEILPRDFDLSYLFVNNLDSDSVRVLLDEFILELKTR
jgi:hypothetical protein